MLVLGLLPAGLALARSLGRAGIPVYGGVFRKNEFGLRSRYLRDRCVATDEDELTRDRRMLAFLRVLAGQGRAILVPERDEHVDFVLRNWEEVAALADVPLPADPDVVQRLRRKDLLPLAAAEAGIAAPATFPVTDEASLGAAELVPPFLLKPVEGQEYAMRFGDKAVVAESVDEAVAAWRRARDAGFEMILQELIPDSHEQVFSLFAYIGRAGEPLASVVGRKVRQGPLRFGTSAVFEIRFDPQVLELGLRLLDSGGYRGFAHVEFALDPRDGMFKVLEVNTRLPVWAGIAMNGHVRRRAHGVRRPLAAFPPAARATFRGDLAWIYLAKDLWVSAQMARRRELSLRDFLAHHVRTGKVRAVFAADDPLPALASVGLPPLEALSDENRARRPIRLHHALRPPPGHRARRSRSRRPPPDLAVPPRRPSQAGGLRARGALHPAVQPSASASPRSRLRRLVKGAEYLPSVRRLLRRIDALEPDVVHVQWLARPELDIRWLRRVARSRPLVLTAHNATVRTRARAREALREAFTTRVARRRALGTGSRPSRRVRGRSREDRPHPACRFRLRRERCRWSRHEG